ncbi:DUF559 domain-containing protein [Geodermatophilus sp. Leaf369]|uniref:DUF559 domain-containing protein n=1 Tax=Geodermatophilus sp. Leaf369 TaxID=1736354 RepID=UPI0009EBE6AD|nr:DUF559 domain-containing protein [Geodermatophilus sp. Leaf369]
MRGLGSAPFRGSAAVARGLLTRHQLAHRRWVRVFPDVYVSADVPLTHEVRVRAAVVLLPGAVVCGRSAARLWGIDVDGPAGDPDGADVEVVLPRRAAGPDGVRRYAGQQRVPGIRVRRRAVLAADLGVVDGVRVTLPPVTALDLAGELPHDEAVAVLDQFCAQNAAGRRLTTLVALRGLADARTGRGCRRARAAAGDADGLAGSPRETQLRLLLHRSDLPRPEAQYRVRDDRGRECARVDFGWPEHRLAVEYDGQGHLRTLGPDRRRMNRLADAGWRVLFVTADDLRDPVRLVAAIARALGVECGVRPPHRRR